MAVGTHKGFVQIWDAAAGKKLSVLEGHTARVGEYWEHQEYQERSRPASDCSQLSFLERKKPCCTLTSSVGCVWGCRGTGLECGPAVVGQPRSSDPAEGHPGSATAVGAQAAGPQAGSVRPQVEH